MKRHPALMLLSQAHHHGLALALRCRKQSLGQLKPMGAEGLRARAREFKDFFAANLIRHFRAEEAILFPFAREQSLDIESLLADLLADHERIRAAERALESEKGLAKLLFDAGDLLERHIRREERELFPFLEQRLDEEKGDALRQRIESILSG